MQEDSSLSPSEFDAQVPLGEESEALPDRFGKYRVIGVLGRGGFKVVYLGYDGELARHVAITVPRPHRVSKLEDLELYMNEARMQASLDHSSIVPVYCVERTEDGLCYVVQKFIEGENLAARIAYKRPSFREAAAIVATVADALHHVHAKGLVHRDIKPANILIDEEEKPVLIDFGLALKEVDIGNRAAPGGTLPYMSPEQVYGEGHRVDGISDIYSLGVVLYQLLTDILPFPGDSVKEVMDRIASGDPRPPRQIDDSIPRELERICLKAMAKRRLDRYTTARDLAEDLRHFLDEAKAGPRTPCPSSDSLGPPPRVVPRGLRAFDAEDADFFLTLLPGPRDRDGIPESVRFWKTRFESRDADATFPVGVLYGPSGCGKSSLVRAGILPRLAEHVRPVLVEAIADGTESRLRRQLVKLAPSLPADLRLAECVAEFRRGRTAVRGSKLLILIDQLEQWLHATQDLENAELVQALRQCDGEHVQSLVLVRDDFWMSLTRWMRCIEVPILEGRNSAAVDLFDLDHARKVLTEFGRAYGTLPQGSEPLSSAAKEFIARAVGDLAGDGKVIPVQLALFAEMVKGDPWTPETLKSVGGARGVGVRFLERTLGSGATSPEHRLHRKAAREVLGALLPERGTDIKGHTRSRSELLMVSGYARRPEEFERLMRILDGELRLLTPIDPEDSSSGERPGRAERRYQLTHDYLVSSLREWSTRKQRETRRGRMEILLAERSVLWNAKPELKQLPTWWEWWNIRLWTRSRDWTRPQRRLMQVARNHHVRRGVAVVVTLALVAWALIEAQGRLKARGDVGRLLDAKVAEVPAIVAKLSPLSRWARSRLDAVVVEEREDLPRRLRASLALLPADPAQVPFLRELMLQAGPEELLVLREALLPHAEGLRDALWKTIDDASALRGLRLRAGCALAAFDPESSRWKDAATEVVNVLVSEDLHRAEGWIEALRPVKTALLAELSRVFFAESLTGSRRVAALALAKFLDGDVERLLAFIRHADTADLLVLAGGLTSVCDRAISRLRSEIGGTDGDATSEGEPTTRASQQVNVAMTLALLGSPEAAWSILSSADRPRVRTLVIDRLAASRIDPVVVVEWLQRTRSEPRLRRALILALGEYDDLAVQGPLRNDLVPWLFEVFRVDPDSGVHSAAEWLLRKWGVSRQELLTQAPRGRQGSDGDRRWYVDSEGHTMVVLSIPGGPPSQPGIEGSLPRPAYSIALASHEVTVEQLERFLRHQPAELGDSRLVRATRAANVVALAKGPQDAVNFVDYSLAAAYCRWLSLQEGVPEEEMCYPEGIGVPYPEYLTRTGYRLPTDEEWHYGCSACEVTALERSDLTKLLEKYSWYFANSAARPKPVGLLKPNDFGLFDTLGNLLEWCHLRDAGTTETSINPCEIHEPDDTRTHQIALGASTMSRLDEVTCRMTPPIVGLAIGTYFRGFRVARTLR